MAQDLRAGGRALTVGFFHALLRNTVAGAVCVTVSLAFSLSYAALVFSGPLTPFLAYGLAATFISTALGGLVMAWRSSLPFALAAPDASTSAVVAALVAALAGRLVAGGATDNLLAATLTALSLGVALTGLVLCGLGIVRAGPRSASCLTR